MQCERSCPIRECAAAAHDIAMAESCGKPKADLLSSPSSSHAPDPEWLGPAYTLIGAFGFSAKSIFAKLAYSAGTVDSVTVLALRMLFSLPFFGAMIWWS